MNGHAHKKKRPAQVWHRWLGFILVIPMLFVCVTGFLLNHVHQLGWNNKHASSNWILARYGMKIEGEPIAFKVGDTYISEWGGQLFWNGTALDGKLDLKGAVPLADGIAVVSHRTVSLHETNGTLIETLDDASLPAGDFENAGVTSSGQLLLLTSEGAVYEFSPDLLSYTQSQTQTPNWTQPVSVPDRVRTAMKRDFRGEGVTWSRVLVDLHSGRFFGVWGRWVVDLCVILLIGLAIVGVVLGIRTIRSNNATSRMASRQSTIDDASGDDRMEQTRHPRRHGQPHKASYQNEHTTSPAGVR